ncbi:MAG: FAD-binding protein [Phycisphaerales bacterium]|nr:FAD-binding protein [Phycisphaerales bacterium]
MTPPAAAPFPALTPADPDLAAAACELASRLKGQVRFGRHDRMLYATDASLYQVEPLGVVIPASIDDAIEAVRLCVDRGLPILPRGGGTSLAGQCTNRAVVIDTSPNCRAVLELDAPARRCRVEPGITIDELNAHLAPSALFFAPDPATSRHCCIGGAIGNNAAGARSIRYGRTSESLLGVDAILATGQRVRLDCGASDRDPVARELTRRIVDLVLDHERLIRERFPKTVRRNAGYGLDMVLLALDQARREGVAEPDLRAQPGWSFVNLAHLLAGSEGTLAVTLGADLLLHPLPAAKGLATVSFESVEAAIDALPDILAMKPSAVELLDDMVLGLAAQNAEYRRYVDLMPHAAGAIPKAVLYIEFFADPSDKPTPTQHIAAALRAVIDRFGQPRVSTHTDPAAMNEAWKLRKAGEPLLHALPGARKPITFIEDNAIPVERLGEFVRRLRDIVQRHATTAAFYAHASVGVLHVRPLIDIHDEADRARMRAIALETAQLARDLGGVMSGEHGDGRVRGPLLEAFYGPELMRAFAETKRIFDPRGLLNPGIIVPRSHPNSTLVAGVPPAPAPDDRIAAITTHLRVLPESRQVRVRDTDTFLTYHDQRGFDAAVEMCNGSGVCRKKQGGTMCPSYMATLDERHSTRGRGNALRLAITGQFSNEGGGASIPAANTQSGTSQPAWLDPETQATLDLCLSCKACKTECPSNVDIARLKAEYTAQGHRESGRVPLASRIMASIRTLNRLGSRTPRLANAVNNFPPVRRLINRVLNLHPSRSLPPFAPSLERDFAARDRVLPAPGDTRPTVALFADCFCLVNEPHIARAARRVLEACGYRVLLPRHACCARPAISLGLLPDAIRTIDQICLDLRPFINDPRVRAILFLEPSCLSAIKDDWLSLKASTPLDIRRRLAAKSFLAEDFIDRHWDDHPNRPTFSTTAREPGRPRPSPESPSDTMILHAHCHQKALWGDQTSARALRRLPGAAVGVLDSGCCGMAGSFGYAEHRYDLSMKIGNLTLFPAVREAPDATICAPGTSCRHQIKDATGVRALHPIEVLAARLSS